MRLESAIFFVDQTWDREVPVLRALGWEPHRERCSKPFFTPFYRRRSGGGFQASCHKTNGGQGSSSSLLRRHKTEENYAMFLQGWTELYGQSIFELLKVSSKVQFCAINVGTTECKATAFTALFPVPNKSYTRI